ncbi:MAG: glycosyltransferase [Lachnospiraceae bacterium]|nr:glycosyltransferase [Lachnospiraceae bacterium]
MNARITLENGESPAKVSIVVPIYHGKHYIPSLIAQAKANAQAVSCGLELLLVNDAPEDPIRPERGADNLRIHILQTDRNRGIHGARVRGLGYAEGEFVLFLDQDDRIAPDYIKRQLAVVKAADAVVCKAYQGEREFYSRNRTLGRGICKESMMREGNQIISPGQVLIRKEAVPAFWKENLLHYNGADDWFLWLCMLCEEKRFVCNEEALFEHVLHAENTSKDSLSMHKSVCEVYEKLKKNKCCTEKEQEEIRTYVEKHGNTCIEERDKFLRLYSLLEDWMTIREQGRSVADYLHRQGWSRVAIYGKGQVGKRLARELLEREIDVSCFIDRAADVLAGEIKAVLPEEFSQHSVPVVITLAGPEADRVSRGLKERGAKAVYMLSAIMEDLKHD